MYSDGFDFLLNRPLSCLPICDFRLEIPDLKKAVPISDVPQVDESDI